MLVSKGCDIARAIEGETISWTLTNIIKHKRGKCTIYCMLVRKIIIYT